MIKKHNKWIIKHAAILVQFIGPVILFGKLLIKGEVIFWGTTYLQFTPWRYYAWEQITNGIIPLWNADNGFGAPLLANYQSALLYPPNILLWLGAAINGVCGIALMQTILVMLHLIASGIGFVLLLRALGYKSSVQAIGGIAYSLCGYQISRASFLSINAILVWIPWLLFVSFGWIEALSKSDIKTAIKYAILHILFTTCQLFAGHAQITWYTQLLVGSWSLTWITVNRKRIECWKPLISFVIISVVAICLAMAQLLPTAEFLLQSQRSQEVGYEYAMNYSFWPWRFLNLISPNLFGNPGDGNYWVKTDNYWENASYIGLIPFVFAIVTMGFTIFRRITLSRTKHITTWFSIGLFFVTIPFALGKHTSIFPFLYKNIPSFDLFQAPSRYIIWGEIALIFLACTGLEKWKKPVGKRLYWSRLGMMGAIAALATGIIAIFRLDGVVEKTYLVGLSEASIWMVLFLFLNLVQPVKKDLRKIWQWLGVGVVLLDLVYAGWKLNPGISTNVFTTKKNQPTDVDSVRRLFVSSIEEEKIKLGKYFMFNTFLPPLGWNSINSFFIPNTNLYSKTSSINNFDPLLPDRYPDWMNMIESLDKTEQTGFLQWVGVDLVETSDNPNSVEPGLTSLGKNDKYHLVPCMEIAYTPADAMEKTLKNLQTGEYTKTVVVEEYSGETYQCEQNDHNSSIVIMEESSNGQALQVESRNAGWLVQADTWYPGWQAYVDDRPTEIVRVNYFLRGLYLRAGNHTIRFQYKPSSFTIGSIISLITLVCLVGTSLHLYRRFNTWEVK